jgi:hypothetical protein
MLKITAQRLTLSTATRAPLEYSSVYMLSVYAHIQRHTLHSRTRHLCTCVEYDHSLFMMLRIVSQL